MERVELGNEVFTQLNSRYSRVSNSVRFDLMLNTAIFFIGVGASGLMIEQFVRLGAGTVHLFDPDIVKTKNLPSQNFSYDDIGLMKPEAMKHRLEACEFEKDNPNIPSLVVTTNGDFLELNDNVIEKMIIDECFKGHQVIFVFASDYHPAQARGNRIALKYKIPTFWVGIYRLGKAGEIIFYIPGHDLSCYRCITETRYEFFGKRRLADHLKGNFRGAGKSSGLPMAASFIDSILSHLIVGFIHMNVEHNQHGELFRRLLVEKRNFIQCQLDPTYKLDETEDIFAQIKGPDLIAFNTIFQQEKVNPECFDCSIGNNKWNHTDYTKEIL